MEGIGPYKESRNARGGLIPGIIIISPQPLPATVFHRVRANFQSHKVIQMRERREVGFDCKPFEGDERFWFGTL